MSVNLKDFRLVNKWTIPDSGPKFTNGASVYIQDQTTRKFYLNDSKKVVQIKCALLAIGTPFVHIVAAIINVAVRVFKVLSLYRFWEGINSGPYQFKARMESFGHDLVRIIGAPLILLGLEFSAIYGLFNPYDGRKLYATFERYFYEGQFNLAPCFQPDPVKHLFGGNMSEQDQF